MVKTILLTLLVLCSTAAPSNANVVETWPPIELTELVLKDSELKKYLHLEVPGRQPLLVLRVGCHPDLELLQLGYSLKLVEPGSADVARALHFTKAKWDRAHAVLELSYPLEGITGRFKFVRDVGGWTLKERKLWEH